MSPIAAVLKANTLLWPRPEWGSADDTSAASYISSSKIGWTTTKDQLVTLSEHSRAMIEKIEQSIHSVSEDYRTRMDKQEAVVSTLYNQLLEAIVNAEKATATSTQHSENLGALWGQCQALKAEIQELTKNAHNEIVALKLA